MDPNTPIEDLDLTVEQGSFVAVLGGNGSGKSTLCKHFNAILLPGGGKVYVDGMDTSREDCLIQIRRTVCMVFQNPDNQIVATVVEEDVAFGPENLGIEPDEIKKRVEESLKSVGMYELKDRQPHLLSGGQKQRVGIARGIITRPKILLCDEPTGALDYKTGVTILKLLQQASRESGMTVIVITHNQAIAPMADRIITMRSGRVVQIAINERPVPVELLEW